MNWKYAVLTRIIFLGVFMSSCASNSGGQNANHLDNKGITCDATGLGDDRFVMCGESGKYAERSSGGTQKDGFVAFGKFGSENFEAYAMGDGMHDFRWEKVAISGSNLIFSGYGFKEKQAVISCYGKGMEPMWSLVSDSLKGIEEPSMCTDTAGNILMMHRNPTVSPYDGFITLINPSGNIQWTKMISLVDDMTELLPLSNGDFLIHYLQKGAYIDAETRKKYFMLPVLQISTKGLLTGQYHFHADRAKFAEINIHKVIQSDQGELYFMGSAQNLAHRKDLLIIKSDLEGKVFWSYTYQTDHQLDIKSASWDAKEGLVIMADAYGFTGGILAAGIGSDGEMKWNNLIPTTAYEQMIDLTSGKDYFGIFYDKILNFATLKTNKSGLSCTSPASKINIQRESAEVVSSTSNTIAVPHKPDWRTIKISMRKLGKLKAISDCKD